MNTKLISICLALVLAGFGLFLVFGDAKKGDPGMEDAYIWLENNESEETKSWAQKQNEKSAQVLKSDERYDEIANEVRSILTAQDRIAYPSIYGDMIRNFWTDENHQRGILRQTTLEDYLSENPNWDVILDIDALNEREGKSWVFKGSDCLPPDYDRCLLELSDGGGDTAVVREFSVKDKAFVDNGFSLPPAKSSLSWIDIDTVLVGTDFGDDSLTTSGYPRIAKIWKRGTPLISAQTIFEGEKSDVSAGGYVLHRPEESYVILFRSIDFFHNESFWYKDGKAVKLPKPDSARPLTVFKGQLILSIKEDWKVGNSTFKQGSLVSLEMDAIKAGKALENIQILFEPTKETAYERLSTSQDALYLNILNNVKGEMLQVSWQDGKWVSTKVALPDNGNVGVVSSSVYSEKVFFHFENFIHPSTLYYMDRERFEAVKSLPEKFDASGLAVKQRFATSKDGTRVPYFLIHKKSIELDGKNPTLLYGYGGFRVSLTPDYSPVLGKVWLEKGGVYALANIRGGEEYGPDWHAQALKKNRHRAYEDFEAVSRDLIAGGVASPQTLGIKGGSNGGLLVGVAATRTPELYNAVICSVPLLDMIRYTLLPPGASWIGEYGDPADPEMADYIRTYSPYQNVKKDASYPEIFFYTSSKDDRVHPGHARKMAAKMGDMGHEVLYYENMEGGHGGAADIEQRVEMLALQYAYLFKKLF